MDLQGFLPLDCVGLFEQAEITKNVNDRSK